MAAEMKIEIILSSEEQEVKLKQEYAKMLHENGLTDLHEVNDEEKTNDITKWVEMNSG